MKIKALFIAVAILACGTSFAQETNKDANGKHQYGPYQTNKFFQNWYIGVGGGLNTGVDGFIEGIKNKNVGDNTMTGFGWNAEVVLGKNITPCFGIRFGWQGLSAGVYKSLNTVFKDFRVLTPGEIKNLDGNNGGIINFNYVHADALWNWSNQFGGYKEKRVVEFVPYTHFGVIWATSPFNFDGSSAMGGGLGLMIPFRVGTRVHIIPDFRTTLTNDRLFYGNIQSGWAAICSATLSVTVGLGKQNFTRVSTTVAASAAALAAAEAAKNALQAEKDKLANALAAANADNEALANQLKALQNAPAAVATQAGSIDLNKAMAIYFEKGKAVLSTKELEHLDFYVKNVISNNQSLKFTVVGSADSASGSKEFNQKLSQDRADYIYNLLTKTYGLTEDNFTVKALGGIENNENPELDRAVLIEVM